MMTCSKCGSEMNDAPIGEVKILIYPENYSVIVTNLKDRQHIETRIDKINVSRDFKNILLKKVLIRVVPKPRGE